MPFVWKLNISGVRRISLRRNNVTVQSGKMSVLGHLNLDCQDTAGSAQTSRQTSFGYLIFFFGFRVLS